MEKDVRKDAKYGRVKSSAFSPRDAGRRKQTGAAINIAEQRPLPKGTTGTRDKTVTVHHGQEHRGMWILLTVIRSMGGVRGRSGLQMLVFLAQRRMKIGGYEFADNEYEPHSEELARDIALNRDLISEETRLDDEYSERHYVYSLTDAGDARLSELDKDADPAMIEKLSSTVREYSGITTPRMLETVYSEFTPRLDGSDHRYGIMAELLEIVVPSSAALAKHHTIESAQVLACMENIKGAMAGIMPGTFLQRIIVFNTSMSIILRCGRIINRIEKPDYSGSLDSAFWDIDEHVQFLVRYCDATGMMKNPYSVPMDDITEEKARRLSEALSKVEIPIS